MLEQVSVKWIRSGNFLEIYVYKDITWVNRPKKKPPKKDFDAEREISHDDRERSIATSINFTKKQLRRKVHANIGIWPEPSGKYSNPSFITLTIHEGGENLRVANGMFMRFIKRLNYFVMEEKGSFLKYIAVPEFQKRGAVHYHCIFFNLPYIPKEKIGELWSHGFIKVEQIKELEGSVEYVLKYMRKELALSIPKGMKRYLASSKLKKPITACGNDSFMSELNMHSIWLDGVQTYTDSYEGEWCGRVDFFLYDLSNCGRKLRDILAMEERYMVKPNDEENNNDIVCDILSTLENHPKAKKDKSSQLKLK